MKKINKFIPILCISLIIILNIIATPTMATTATINNESVEQKIVVTSTIPTDPEYPINKGDTLYNTILLEPQEDLSNVVVNIQIPEGITIKEAIYVNGKAETTKEGLTLSNNKVTFTTASLKKGTIQAIRLTLEIANIKGEFSYKAEVTADNMQTHYSNETKYTVAQPQLEITQTSTNSKNVKETQQIIYKFTIKNTGNSDVTNVVFKDILPEGLSFVKLQYKYLNKTTDIISSFNNTAKVRWTSFKAGETCEITLTAKANLLPEGKKDKEVVNTATIEGAGLETIQSNTIKNTIQYNLSLYEGSTNNNSSSEEKPNNNSNKNENKKYKITGTAWLDSNGNGKREDREELLSGISVVLIDEQKNKVVKEVISQKGKYEFENISSNEYLILFLYDTEKFTITEYQKKGVSEKYNSDARNAKITFRGEQGYAGLSNTVKVKNGNIANIDIGLCSLQNFDLSLEKYISKITLTTPTIGTEIYNYNKGKVEKIEILSENVNKSNFVVEYKIVVKNEGKVPGYATKIADYIPTEMKFNSEINQDWYVSSDGKTIFTNSLENEILNPGESKEITLILSMQISDKTIGTIVNNNAEIYESYNKLGLKDTDSTEANKLEKEDDFSKTEIVLSVATGNNTLYLTVIGTILMLIAISIPMIKNKVLKERDVKK